MDAFLELWHQGGFVMPFLLGALVLLWYGLGWRFLTLQRGDRRPLPALVAEARAGRLPEKGVLATAVVWAVRREQQTHAHLREQLEDVIFPIRDEMSRFRAPVATVVVLAPLAGLLGTVTGMIETFDSLAEMALFTQGGGVAAGISEALVTTQMGLAVAIPGVILGRLLDRKQDVLEDELDELVERICTEAA